VSEGGDAAGGGVLLPKGTEREDTRILLTCTTMLRRNQCLQRNIRRIGLPFIIPPFNAAPLRRYCLSCAKGYKSTPGSIKCAICEENYYWGVMLDQRENVSERTRLLEAASSS